MKRKGAAINVSLAIFTFIATTSIVDVSLTSFINVDELVRAATIELQATRLTTAAYAATALEGDSYITLKLPRKYTVYGNNFPEKAEKAMAGDNFIRPNMEDYPGVIHIGEGDNAGYAPIGYGQVTFEEKTNANWCIHSDGTIDVKGECG